MSKDFRSRFQNRLKVMSKTGEASKVSAGDLGSESRSNVKHGRRATGPSKGRGSRRAVSTGSSASLNEEALSTPREEGGFADPYGYVKAVDEGSLAGQNNDIVESQEESPFSFPTKEPSPLSFSRRKDSKTSFQEQGRADSSVNSSYGRSMTANSSIKILKGANDSLKPSADALAAIMDESAEFQDFLPTPHKKEKKSGGNQNSSRETPVDQSNLSRPYGNPFGGRDEVVVRSVPPRLNGQSRLRQPSHNHTEATFQSASQKMPVKSVASYFDDNADGHEVVAAQVNQHQIPEYPNYSRDSNVAPQKSGYYPTFDYTHEGGNDYTRQTNSYPQNTGNYYQREVGPQRGRRDVGPTGPDPRLIAQAQAQQQRLLQMQQMQMQQMNAYYATNPQYTQGYEYSMGMEPNVIEQNLPATNQQSVKPRGRAGRKRNGKKFRKKISRSSSRPRPRQATKSDHVKPSKSMLPSVTKTSKPSRRRSKSVGTKKVRNVTFSDSTYNSSESAEATPRDFYSGSYADIATENKKPKYKPYTIDDYRISKSNAKNMKLGGLGSNVGSEEWEKKKEKRARMMELAAQVNSKNLRRRAKRSSVPPPARTRKLSTREKAKLYSSGIPKPPRRSKSVSVPKIQKNKSRVRQRAAPLSSNTRPKPPPPKRLESETEESKTEESPAPNEDILAEQEDRNLKQRDAVAEIRRKLLAMN